MKDKTLSIKEFIKSLITNEVFAILSTENNGQPHPSLVAVTPLKEVKSLLFATYKDTRKYENISHNPKVSILFDNRSCELRSSKEINVITAFGVAKEVPIENYSEAKEAHLAKHPDLNEFLASNNCVLFEVDVDAYQIVKGIENVEWYKTEEF